MESLGNYYWNVHSFIFLRWHYNIHSLDSHSIFHTQIAFQRRRGRTPWHVKPRSENYSALSLIGSVARRTDTVAVSDEWNAKNRKAKVVNYFQSSQDATADADKIENERCMDSIVPLPTGRWSMLPSCSSYADFTSVLENKRVIQKATEFLKGMEMILKEMTSLNHSISQRRMEWFEKGLRAVRGVGIVSVSWRQPTRHRAGSRVGTCAVGWCRSALARVGMPSWGRLNCRRIAGVGRTRIFSQRLWRLQVDTYLLLFENEYLTLRQNEKIFSITQRSITDSRRFKWIMVFNKSVTGPGVLNFTHTLLHYSHHHQ